MADQERAATGPPEPSPWADPTANVWLPPASHSPTNSAVPPQQTADMPRAHDAVPAGAVSAAALPKSHKPPTSLNDNGARPRTDKGKLAILTGAVVVALVVIAAIIVVAIRSVDDSINALDSRADSPVDQRPELAKLCPAPTDAPSPGPIQPPPPGPRVNDTEAGISYSQLGDPFKAWDQGDWNSGDLGIEFLTGYYFVTEEYEFGEYLASVLSGSVPATVGDSLTVNLECAGQQVAEDVRRAYYPQPNEREDLRNEYTTLGGLPAWVSIFHLTFSQSGLDATGEWVAVVTVDVGRTTAGVLYVSLPDTHQQHRPALEDVIASIRPSR